MTPTLGSKINKSTSLGAGALETHTVPKLSMFLPVNPDNAFEKGDEEEQEAALKLDIKALEKDALED